MCPLGIGDRRKSYITIFLRVNITVEFLPIALTQGSGVGSRYMRPNSSFQRAAGDFFGSHTVSHSILRGCTAQRGICRLGRHGRRGGGLAWRRERAFHAKKCRFGNFYGTKWPLRRPNTCRTRDVSSPFLESFRHCVSIMLEGCCAGAAASLLRDPAGI